MCERVCVPSLPTDRDGADRERDSIFRIRERTRWLDSALREDGTLSRLDRDRTDGILGVGGPGEQKRGAGVSSNPLVFGEDLQHWPERVGIQGELPVGSTVTAQYSITAEKIRYSRMRIYEQQLISAQHCS